MYKCILLVALFILLPLNLAHGGRIGPSSGGNIPPNIGGLGPTNPPILAGFYVNCNAGSNGTGTAASPFNNLASAQTAMENSSTIKTTYVEGTCNLSSNWVLGSSDSNESWLGWCGTSIPGTINGGVTTQTQPEMTTLCPNPAAYSETNGYLVEVNGANNVTVEGLTFENLASKLASANGVGTGGLYLTSTSGDTVRWNTFNNSTMSAIALTYAKNTLIDSNTINGVSDGFPSSGFNPATIDSYGYQQGYLCYSPAAIFQDSLSGNGDGDTISHNLIENTQGGAVTFVGNNLHVDSNIATNIQNVCYDCGGIYTWMGNGQVTGEQITNNNISSWGGTYGPNAHVTGLYMDDTTSNVSITGNTFCQTVNLTSSDPNSADVLLSNTTGVTNNTLSNNIFALSFSWEIENYGCSGSNGCTVENNIFYSTGGFSSSLYQNGGGVCPTVSTNLYWSATGATIPNTVCADSNPIDANPQFTNYSTCNFAMPGNSPAFTEAGFTALTTNRGPTTPAYCGA